MRNRVRTWWPGIGRAGGFAINLGLLAVLSLLLIPLLIKASDAAGWGAIALGQAIGLVASVILAYGWGFHGPANIARRSESHEAIATEVLESVKLRLLLLPVVGLVGGLLAWAASPANALLATAGFASMLTLGLRMNWVFVGLKSPKLLFIFETLPRVLGLGVATAGLAWFGIGPAIALGVVAASNAVSMALTLIWTRRLHRFRGLRLRGTWALLRAHWHGVVGLTTSALWATAPTYAVALIAPLALPSFALAMRVYAQANTASSPVVDVFQGWVPTNDAQQTKARAVKALWLSTIVALLGVGVYVLLAAPVFGFLGAGQVQVSVPEQLLVGLAIGLSVVVQTANRACLAALGLGGHFSMITLIGSLAGLATLLIGVPLLGGAGGVLAVVVSLAVQAILAVAIIVRGGRGSSPRRAKDSIP